MTWRAGMYHAAPRKTTPEHAQNPQFRATLSFRKQLQCLEFFREIIPTRYLFFPQLSYVLYTSQGHWGSGWQCADNRE
jgi:hypothetical protein